MESLNFKKIQNVKDRIEESIKTQKPLIFTYTKWNEYQPEERRVVFHHMYSRNKHFYAVGYCLKRKDWRTFRFDRIGEIKGFGSLNETIPAFAPELPDDSVQVTESIFEEIKTEAENHIWEERAERRGCIITFLIVFIIIGGLIFGYILGNYPGMWDKIFGKKDDYYLPSYSILYTKIKGHNRNINYPMHIKIEDNYRGFHIEKKSSYYRIEGLKKKYRTLYEVIIEINTQVFKKLTGIQDKEVLSIYINADTNKDGFLSWKEIQDFQMKINREFKYISNYTALRPDEFVKAGGGDCEDWALFSAGFLRFWGYDSYIGLLNFKENYHAVALVRVDELPRRFKGYRITSARLKSGEPLPGGIYTFIDYYKVGKLTLASGRKPRLIGISEQEWCYGRNM